MGRQMRRVIEDWKHPTNADGYIPLRGDSYIETRNHWIEQKIQWDMGFVFHFDTKKFIPKDERQQGMKFLDWAGNCPEKLEYMPEWAELELTHCQMYENTTEGTPISPVMETSEELAQWLVDNNANYFAGQTATYEEWLNVCNGDDAGLLQITILNK